MKKSERRHGFAPMILMLVLLGTGAQGVVCAKTFMTEDFASGTTRPVTLVLLPPQAEFIKAKALATEEMVEECAALETAAVEALLRDLRAKGYEVRYLGPEELGQEPQLLQLVMGVNARYDSQWPSIVKKPRAVKDGGYVLGTEVADLCALLGVDGVLVSRIQAVAPTLGRAMLLGFLGGGMAKPDSYGRLDLSFVGADGVIEAYFFKPQQATLKQLLQKPDRVMEKACKKSLNKLPQVGTAAETTATVDEDEEEDIVGELEELLAKGEGGGGGS